MPFQISAKKVFSPAKNPFANVSFKMSIPAPYPENRKKIVRVVVRMIYSIKNIIPIIFNAFIMFSPLYLIHCLTFFDKVFAVRNAIYFLVVHDKYLS